ncbi:MAG TPA: hypothetical protein VHW09_02775 [Bryobacteraceae bacterium]|jgi:photosystem II stability/assembly factor-like uncharacterized protein|nr:hypothetical protein [Bryobacteraceae bacterium]
MCRLGAIFLVTSSLLAAQTAPADMLAGLQWRSIGPAATGGRIADLAVVETANQPTTIYVATTSGGIFKSMNDGVSFAPVFDHAGGMMSIGAVAVAPSDSRVVWAGTGEADNRQSSSWGDGVYKSVNGGFTWIRMGLADTRHIGKIVIDPADPNVVWVAAVGHLWGSNDERGVYKTIDGGASWKKVLYKDENTGAIDLAMDPHDRNVVYAALYQRQRKGWGFNGGGPGSGIYRTTDGGATWAELTNGLPGGDKGRIGITLSARDSHTVYAVVEADPANSGGVFRSTNRGDSWEHLSSLNPRPMYYSRIYIDPRDPNRIYLMGSNRGLWVSDDAGRSFHDIFSGVHGEDHVLWIDPENSSRLIVGGDGGVSISYDRGLSWLFRTNLPIGQFYNIAVNNSDPYLICGGLQDNGNWCTPSSSRMDYGISFRDAFNIGGGDGMQTVFEDDHTVLVSSQNGNTARVDLNNMERQVIGAVKPLDHSKPPYRWYWTAPLIASQLHAGTIYTGANVLFRSDDSGVSWRAVSPDLTANVDRERLQMMGMPVPRRAFSRHDGQASFSALTTIAESPLDQNLLYTGADDGTVEVTRDGGKQWSNLTANLHDLPPGLNISGIVASQYVAGRVYVTADGHFNDDYHAYVFVSEDYGASWRRISDGLPETSVHRLREHPSNPNLLVAGLETGVFASFDRGAHWAPLDNNMPPVPVYDLVFQQRDHALVLGTHGRGVWILDHAQPLGELTGDVLASQGYLFPVPAAHYRKIFVGQYWFGAGEFFAPNPPLGAEISYYLPARARDVQVAIADAAGKTVRTLRGSAQAGINRLCWDLRHAAPLDSGLLPGNCGMPVGRVGPLVLPGEYRVTVKIGDAVTLSGPLTVLPDPAFAISDADRMTRQTAVMSAYSLQQQLAAARTAYERMAGQMAGARQNGSERMTMQAGDLLDQIAHCQTEAYSVETAMDAYQGLPTAAQMADLDRVWTDGIAAVAGLNRIIEDTGLSAVPVPVR